MKPSSLLLLAVLGQTVVAADDGAGEGENPALRATAGRDDTRVRFLSDEGKTVIDIESRSGIDRAIIRRQADAWPESVLVRLHLAGLESFTASSGEVAVEWSVSSTGDHAARVTLRNGKAETALDAKSPFYTAVRIVGGNGKVPLKGGYFEVPLPARLFEGNPAQITLRWIDFYRN